MPIKFVTDYPAVLISDKKFGKLLAIADLHLGIEHELYNAGIIIAPQAEKFKEKIGKLLKMTKADTLVIVGDLKHKVPGISFRELKEIPKLIDYLTKKVHVILAKGNHDTELKDISENMEVYSSRGFKIGKYGFFHGHAWPEKSLLTCDYLFTAHIHPAIEFVDGFGFRMIEQAWVKGKLDKKMIRAKYKMKRNVKNKKRGDEKLGELKTIIIPPFNPLIGGAALNSKKKREYVGPLTKSGAFNISKSEAFLLDGIPLGKVNKLKKRQKN